MIGMDLYALPEHKAKIDAGMIQQILGLLAQEALGCRLQADLAHVVGPTMHLHRLPPILDRMVREGLIVHLGGSYSDPNSVFQLAERTCSVLMGSSPSHPVPCHLRSLAHVVGAKRSLCGLDRAEHSRYDAVGCTGQRGYENDREHRAVRALCSCDWKGPWRGIFESTEEDYFVHRTMNSAPDQNGPHGPEESLTRCSTANGNHVQDEEWARECARRQARDAEKDTQEQRMAAARARRENPNPAALVVHVGGSRRPMRRKLAGLIGR